MSDGYGERHPGDARERDERAALPLPTRGAMAIENRQDRRVDLVPHRAAQTPACK